MAVLSELHSDSPGEHLDGETFWKKPDVSFFEILDRIFFDCSVETAFYVSGGAFSRKSILWRTLLKFLTIRFPSRLLKLNCTWQSVLMEFSQKRLKTNKIFVTTAEKLSNSILKTFQLGCLEIILLSRSPEKRSRTLFRKSLFV